MSTAITLHAGTYTPRVYSLPPEAEQQKAVALEAAALVAVVRNADENAVAVGVQKSLKDLISLVEKARKAAKEPILEEGRQLDSCVKAFLADLEAEHLRISTEIGNFQQEELAKLRREQQRIADEQRKIEEARQAELRRIEQERIEAERKAREEADKLAREAKTKAEKERAEQARVEAELAAAQAAVKAKEFAEAEAAQRLESVKPSTVVPVRAAGQTVRTEPEVTRIDSFVLMRARPDLVREITFDMIRLKDELKRGVKLPGVEWHEKVVSTTLGGEKPAINV